MNRLKKLRKEKELTQEELAREIEVSKITVLRWENGERQIKSDKAQKLADYFGVSVGYLLGYTNNIEQIPNQYTSDLIKKYTSNEIKSFEFYSKIDITKKEIYPLLKAALLELNSYYNKTSKTKAVIEEITDEFIESLYYQDRMLKEVVIRWLLLNEKDKKSIIDILDKFSDIDNDFIDL